MRDIRVKYNPLRDWKREVILVSDDRIKYKIHKRYRLTFKGEVVIDNLKTIKEVNEYLKTHVK
jgi:hypothetical protein